jgi:hypothetical protein
LKEAAAIVRRIAALHLLRERLDGNYRAVAGEDGSFPES